MYFKFFFTTVFVLAWAWSAAQPLFPDRCAGVWEGMMHIYADGALRDSVKVRFTVAPREADAWTWKMEYLSEKMPMTKDYVLRLKDKERQVYVTDEGEGIELRDHLYGNKLYSVFETEGILLTASYELAGAALVFEVTACRKMDATDSPVQSYSVGSVQRAVMKKMP